ncbi:MAG: methylenetetrahydrofolate reductase [NAD(P)H] [Polyangiaceae bacterium]|nr:methylenetetrahydrofolate reductase [NAD(P)H] [Polyangiaceae bacterium]
MRILEKLRGAAPAFSFEFFPPKGPEGVEQLFQTVERLRAYEPAYVSVTYGAGGSTRRLTVELVGRIQREAGLEAVAHLTCVGSTRAELAGVLDELSVSGVENVLALRGDPPRGEERFVQPEGGLAHASELVAFVRERGGFGVAAACYPETHVEAPDAATDLAHLAHKVACGVDFLVTQLFFDEELYFEFVRRARAAGIACPIVPGIMPVTNVAQVKRFTAMCGAAIPPALLTRLEAAPDDAAVRALGVEHAIEQCRALLRRGAPGIHFYTLNRSTATVRILEAIR